MSWVPNTKINIKYQNYFVFVFVFILFLVFAASAVPLILLNRQRHEAAQQAAVSDRLQAP